MIYFVHNRDSHLFRSVLRISYVLFTRSEMRNVENVRSAPRRFDISIFNAGISSATRTCCTSAEMHEEIRGPTKIEIYTTTMGYITALYVYAVDPEYIGSNCTASFEWLSYSDSSSIRLRSDSRSQRLRKVTLPECNSEVTENKTIF